MGEGFHNISADAADLVGRRNIFYGIPFIPKSKKAILFQILALYLRNLISLQAANFLPKIIPMIANADGAVVRNISDLAAKVG